MLFKKKNFIEKRKTVDIGWGGRGGGGGTCWYTFLILNYFVLSCYVAKYQDSEKCCALGL